MDAELGKAYLWLALTCIDVRTRYSADVPTQEQLSKLALHCAVQAVAAFKSAPGATPQHPLNIDCKFYLAFLECVFLPARVCANADELKLRMVTMADDVQMVQADDAVTVAMLSQHFFDLAAAYVGVGDDTAAYEVLQLAMTVPRFAQQPADSPLLKQAKSQMDELQPRVDHAWVVSTFVHIVTRYSSMDMDDHDHHPRMQHAN